jgi:hypothetical protein
MAAAGLDGRQGMERTTHRVAREVRPPQLEALRHMPLLLRRARQAETAAHINEWLRSPGLRPPVPSENFLSDRKK